MSDHIKCGTFGADISPEVRARMDADRDNAERDELLRRALAALEWLTHIAHGVGKAGEKPEPGEFEAAVEQARAVLAEAERVGVGR